MKKNVRKWMTFVMAIAIMMVVVLPSSCLAASEDTLGKTYENSVVYVSKKTTKLLTKANSSSRSVSTLKKGSTVSVREKWKYVRVRTASGKYLKGYVLAKDGKYLYSSTNTKKTSRRVKLTSKTKVVKTYRNWWKVTTSSGKTGWVRKEYLTQSTKWEQLKAKAISTAVPSGFSGCGNFEVAVTEKRVYLLNNQEGNYTLIAEGNFTTAEQSADGGVQIIFNGSIKTMQEMYPWIVFKLEVDKLSNIFIKGGSAELITTAGDLLWSLDGCYALEDRVDYGLWFTTTDPTSELDWAGIAWIHVKNEEEVFND